MKDGMGGRGGMVLRECGDKGEGGGDEVEVLGGMVREVSEGRRGVGGRGVSGEEGVVMGWE